MKISEIFMEMYMYCFQFVIVESRQKGGDLTQSYDKSPYTHGNVKRAK